MNPDKCNIKIILIKVSILAALLFSGNWLPTDLIAQQEGGIDRPDMVIFLSDDHTWRDSSVYGSPDIETPNMARLAKAGMTFYKAYVASPSCAPSRAALLTGLYPANNGAEPNHSRPRADIKKLPAYPSGARIRSGFVWESRSL